MTVDGGTEPGYVLAGVFTVSLTLAAILGRLRAPVPDATVCFGALVLGASVVTRRWAAAAAAAIAWSMLTGFVVNALGTLTFTPVDLGRLVALVGLAVGTAHCTTARGREAADDAGTGLPRAPVSQGEASSRT